MKVYEIFQNHIPVTEEATSSLEKDISKTEAALKVANDSMDKKAIDKMYKRLVMLKKKRKSLTESTDIGTYKKKLVKMTKSQLERELKDLQQLAKAGGGQHQDDMEDEIVAVKNALKRIQ